MGLFAIGASKPIPLSRQGGHDAKTSRCTGLCGRKQWTCCLLCDRNPLSLSPGPFSQVICRTGVGDVRQGVGEGGEGCVDRGELV